MTTITRKTSEPPRQNITWEEIWKGEDKGLIRCWETGRELANSRPELAEAAQKGELPTTNWKGGVSRALKKLEKYGALQYLAQWQGLRGEDLTIDLTQEVTVTCSKTGMVITFTPDISKLIDAATDENAEESEHDDRPSSGVPEQSLFS